MVVQLVSLKVLLWAEKKATLMALLMEDYTVGLMELK
jgi:hypothetical protein